MTDWASLAERVNRAGLKAFGEAIRYEPKAGLAFDLPSGGVFTAAYESLEAGPEASLASTAPILGVLLIDFPSGQAPGRGDHLTRQASGERFRVVEIQPDGVAGARLILQRA